MAASHPAAPQGADGGASVATASQSRLMRQATAASVAVACALVTAKLFGWLATESVSLLSSLIDSSLDLVASAITFLAVRHALVPADPEHRFGHGKVEAIAGLAQSGFIAASGFGLLLTAGDRVLHPHQVRAETVGLAVMALSIALTSALVLFQRHVVRRTGSVAIGADSTHYRGDLLTNMAAAAAVVAAGRLDLPWIDVAVCAAIALYLLRGAWHAGIESYNILMDRELPDAERDRIKAIVRAHPEVRAVHDLRTRSAGLTRFVQLHIELDPEIRLIEAHRIGDEVEAAILAAYPGSEVILHHDPHGLEEPRPRFA